MNTILRKSLFPRVLIALRLDLPKQLKQYSVNGIGNINLTCAPIKYPKNDIRIHTIRNKSEKREQDSDDENDYEDDHFLARDSKIVKFNTTSLRTDLILKSALGTTRNKIEQHFYESKIRINGKKIMKKSATVQVGDEIDLIKTVSPKNPEHIYVSRVEVLDVTANEDSITITARRFKSLLIENYEIDPYKQSGNIETN